MKNIIIAAFAILSLSSCKNSGTPVKTTDAGNRFGVVWLFEVDGISVYRFDDCGNTVYFTNGTGKVQLTRTKSYYNPSTKTTRRHKEVTETICNGR